MTFYRHFIERGDFTTFVATTSRDVEKYELPYAPLTFDLPRPVARAARTRFLPWVGAAYSLAGGCLLPRRVRRAASDFHPDAVFTVAGTWDWTALAACRVARELNVPLIASFNDWFDFGWFPCHPRMRPLVERRFRRFYDEADLALCTSEGMQEALGPHPNVHILYPTGAPMSAAENPAPLRRGCPDPPFTVFFGGSLGEWYGPMLESLVRRCRDAHPEIQFRIFGSQATWSAEFEAWARDSHVYGGHVSFEELTRHAAEADLLLLPMGFSEACVQVERTSFKTKFLDYLSFQRPIMVWGPEYCSAVRTAREFDSAEICIDVRPETCCAAMAALLMNPERRRKLVANARRMYEDRFHPDVIHCGLVDRIKTTIVDFRRRHPR